MDAIVGNVRNSLESGVRKMKMLTVPQQKMSAAEFAESRIFNSQKQASSKYFGVSLDDICQREVSDVPFIVKDLCSYISNNAIKLEGIFRISAPQKQISRLKNLYEENQNYVAGLLASVPDVDGHAPAGLLKHFFRLLPKALIVNDVLTVSQNCKALSDKEFVKQVSETLQQQSVPHQQTLKYLLGFLRVVMRTPENRMSATGLSVVFGPNVFDISKHDNVLQAQTHANNAFHRLLSCSESLIFSEPATNATMLRTRRPAPPVPPQVTPTQVVAPNVPERTTSLQSSLNISKTHLKVAPNTNESSEATSPSPLSLSPACTIATPPDISSPEQQMLEDSISMVVKKRLFSDSSDSSSLTTEQNNSPLLKSLTAGRVGGPKNRRKPSPRKQRLLNNVSFDSSEESENEKIDTKNKHPVPKPRSRVPSNLPEIETSKEPMAEKIESNNVHEQINNVISTSLNAVMTPDSGCITEEHDRELHCPRTSSPIQNNYAFEFDENNATEKVFVPKLNLQNSYDDDEARNKKLTPMERLPEVIPPLDLSDVTEGEIKISRKSQKMQNKENSNAPKRKSSKKIKKKSEILPMVAHSPPPKKLVEVPRSFVPGSPMTHEKYYARMLRSLNELRNNQDRPYELPLLTPSQIKEEKLAIQNELLKYEAKFGRPSEKSTRDLMRGIYDRYRAIKKLMRHHQEISLDESSGAEQSTPHNDFLAVTQEITFKNSEDLLEELNEQICELRIRRKKVRKILREFESAAHAEGKSPEKSVMRKEYEQYRQIKAKLQDLEEAIKSTR